MAVTFKTDSTYGYGILPYFGVGAALIQKAKNCGVTISQSSPGNFGVCYQDKCFGTVVIKGQVITLAKAGNLGPASKDSWRFQFEELLTKAIADSEGQQLAQTPPVVQIQPAMDSLVATLKEKLASKNEQDTKLPEDVPLAKADTKTACAIVKWSKIPLGEAKVLYQPVFGTSSGSTYYTVAMLTGMNIAARKTSTVLSLRVEGSGVMTYFDPLKELGFNIKSNYGSVHFDVSSMDDAKRTLGAVVGRLGFSKVIGVADFDIFQLALVTA